jgi:FKBP-type peptidyl-prolyl cis-trans isomerase FklB
MNIKKTIVFVLAGLCATTALAAQEPKTQKEKLSYTIGYQVGQDFKEKGLELDADTFARAVKDVLTGKPLAMTESDMRAALETFREELMEKQRQLAEKNKKEGEDFLKANAKKKGVKTLPSGLQYKVITAGKGKSPTAEDTVVANYRGTLINGEEFDSSYKRGQPATFPLRGVIKGWQEALPLMKEGAKWQIFVPSQLGYGPNSPSPAIGPNATLIFEIELVSIKEATKPAEEPKKAP